MNAYTINFEQNQKDQFYYFWSSTTNMQLREMKRLADKL